MQPKLIADYQCVTGENPLWHPIEKQVYWLDIPNGRLFRYDAKTGEHENFYTHHEAVGGFTTQTDGSLLMFMARGSIGIFDLKTNEIEMIIDEIPDERESRFNDVIADPKGRVFCGTMPQSSRLGKLYRLDLDGTITEILDEIGCSNGLGFTRDLTKLYYTDSPKREIYLFDYDLETGEISNKTVFTKTPENEGVPDGMTVDDQGYVWSARWDGSCLARFDQNGDLVQKIDFPVLKVSSVTFGGEDLTDMYMTTAGGNDKKSNGDGAGALFHLNLGIKGVPEFYSKIGS